MTGWPDTIWLTKQQRIDHDYALFGEFSFDFTDKLTATVGAALLQVRQLAQGLLRLRRRLQRLHRRGRTAPDGAARPRLQRRALHEPRQDDEGGRHDTALNLTYKFNDDQMVYAT